MMEAATPCLASRETLDLVNAIFNGFQMVLLTYLGHRVKQNGFGPPPRKRTARTRSED